MSTPREILMELLRRAAANDPAQADMYADDAVHELPFAPSGKPMTMTATMLKASMAESGSAKVVDQSVDVRTLISEGEVACAEYEMKGTLTRTGEPFSLAGVMIVRVRGGQIVHSRSYLDPHALTELMA